MRKHFILGKPINIYKFKRPITFTFNKMHLQNNVLLQCLHNVKDTYTNTLFISFFAFRFVISHIVIESTFTIDSAGESCPVCHSVAMGSHIQY